MARRHPILSFVVIVLIIVALVHFSRSFDVSSTLSHVQQFSPNDAASANTETNNAFSSPQGSHNAGDSNDLTQFTHGDVHSETSTEAAPVHDLDSLAAGKPIMAKMPNQTIRAQVGNAGWKLLHTILAQYPEEPSLEDRETLSTFLKFFSRVYPCRECAEHFQELLKQHPPQLSSRKVAVLWGCDAHNKVNKRLGKEIFDCAYIFDKYDCGCGSQEDDSTEKKPAAGVQGAAAVPADAVKTDEVPLVRGG